MAATEPQVEVYRRADGKFDWRLTAANSQIVATSGGQGYEREADAMHGLNVAMDAFRTKLNVVVVQFKEAKE